RWGEATIAKIAVNAVMAGCKPEYFPVVVTAVKAILARPFNLYGVQGTTNPARPSSIAKIAVNAVMAGCKPEYFPVVVTAVKAILARPFNLYGVQGTTNPASP